jgi:hypothetical protein
MGEDRTRDHVPPQSFFPPLLRKERNYSRLEVVYAHELCNGSYKLDEEYFLQSLAPLARRTEAGPALWDRIARSDLKPPALRLRSQIASEFSRDAFGRFHKTYDRERVNRVIRKIIRGLWFLHYKKVLSQEHRYDIAIYDPNNKPPTEFLEAIKEEPTFGPYSEIFFFKATRFTQQPVHAWTLFLWDWFVIVVTVHETGCECERCSSVISA